MFSPGFCSQSEEERESDVEIICLAPGFNLGSCVQSEEERESDVEIICLAPGFVRRVRERVRAMLKLFKLAPGFNLEYNENN